ncbi:unnamed protein product [Symbiodinium natans]|uniref:Uncharacterized protein n=1 Tax=Symbiodinium natans TaxID=878477 RepID=A0A812R3P9_9DINO|nr:unnamed protein product [Symbiodinium natans]
MLQRASRSAGYMLQEDHMLNHSHGNGSNGTNNATQKAQRIIEAVDACLHPRHVEAAGHEDTLLRLEFVRMAEILTRLVAANISVSVLGDGYTDDPQMIAAAEVAGRDAAEHLVMKEFEAEMLEVLAGSNLSQHAIEHFAGKVSEEGIASDLSYIMNSTSGFLSFEEAEVAMDISLYVEGLCQSDVLDIDYFVGTFGENVSECSELMLAQQSAHLNKHLATLDYYAKSALVLHDEHNNLAHHFAKQLHPDTRSPVATASVETMIHNASLTHADNRAKMTRLLYLDRKYYEKVHGHSKEEYCDRNSRLLLEKPQHWISRSPEIQAYVDCLCTKRKAALLCDAEHAEPLARIRPSVIKQVEVEHGETSCQEAGKRANSMLQLDAEGKPAAVSCSLCINGNNCIDTSGTTIDVFSALKPLFGISSSCITGACTPCLGIKPGDALQFKMDIGVDVASCSSTSELLCSLERGLWALILACRMFATFNIFAELKLCIGGIMGEVFVTSEKLVAMEHLQISWHPFINKLHLLIPSLPVPLPAPIGVRGTIEANLNLGDLTAAVVNHCESKGASASYRCFKDMYNARGVTSVEFGVEALLGVRIPFVGEAGEGMGGRNDNSRELAMNKAGVTIVHIGPSSVYKVCGRAFSGVNCEHHAADKGYRANDDWSWAGDDFHIWRPTTLHPITSRSLCLMRVDAELGWAMNLEIACEVDNSNLGILVPIGSSTVRTKCVLPSEPAARPALRTG